MFLGGKKVICSIEVEVKGLSIINIDLVFKEEFRSLSEVRKFVFEAIISVSNPFS
jgi:hypothetical protein